MPLQNHHANNIQITHHESNRALLESTFACRSLRTFSRISKELNAVRLKKKQLYTSCLIEFHGIILLLLRALFLGSHAQCS